MSNQESLPNHAFPKVHTKDEQNDEKYGLNIDKCHLPLQNARYHN